jgi:hypothetical protein
MTAVLDRPAAEDQGTEAAAPVVNSMSAKDLHTVVSDALNFAASTSVNIPAFAAVRFEVTDGQFVAIATDSYVLGVSRVDYAGAAFVLTVGIGDAKNLARITKTVKRAEASRTVEIDIDDLRVSFRFSTGEALTVTGLDVQYPQWRRLIPSTDERMAPAGVVGTGYNPAALAKFSRVRPEERSRRAVLFPTRSECALAPTVVQIGEDFIGAVMPTKPAGDAEAYQPPAWIAAASTNGAWC